MTASAHLDGDQLIATRNVDADLAVVWRAFTTPQRLAAFWGGHHATVPPDSVTVDLRVGGTFELIATGADGASSTLHFQYEVVESPTRLVLFEPRTGITTEICLESAGRGTTVTVLQRRLPPELRTDQARAGLAGILDQLADIVRTMSNE